MTRHVKMYRLYEKQYRERVNLRVYEEDIKSAIRQVSRGRGVQVAVYSDQYHVWGNYTPGMARAAGEILANSGSPLAQYCVYKYGGYKLFIKFKEEEIQC